MNLIVSDTQRIGSHFLHYTRCESTNYTAQQLVQNNQAKDGTIVHADFQTDGRGQQRSLWESNEGQNLTFSVIVFPQLPIEEQHFLTIATALSVYDTLVSWDDLPINIKWPNDILCESSKICGILIQNNLKGRKIHSTVVGIGLNVNQVQFSSPRATSLSLLTGRYWNRQEVLHRLVGNLEHRFEQLRQGQRLMLQQEYLEYLFWKDELHQFSDENETFYGTIAGVDETGKLAVRVGETLRYYATKELVYNF